MKSKPPAAARSAHKWRVFETASVLSIPLEEIDGLEAGDPDFRAFRRLTGECVAGAAWDVCWMASASRWMAARRSNHVAKYDLFATPPGPLEREHIKVPLVTGIRAIDGLLPCGLGQRIGLFGGSGVGKSTLLGAMARHNSADVTVIALIGERNREVRGFLEDELGPEGHEALGGRGGHIRSPCTLTRARLLCSLGRCRIFSRSRQKRSTRNGFRHSSCHGATRDRFSRRRTAQPKGLHALGLRHSAQDVRTRRQFSPRQHYRVSLPCLWKATISTSLSPTPPAVFSTATLFFRASLGAAGHYPAIDVLSSISRVASHVAPPEHLKAAAKVREAMASINNRKISFRSARMWPGPIAKLDASIRSREKILNFLRQRPEESNPLPATVGAP